MCHWRGIGDPVNLFPMPKVGYLELAESSRLKPSLKGS